MKILVSACLLGEPVRYDGGAKLVAGIARLAAKHQLIAFCPEVAGGLPVPRDPAEITGSAIPILQRRGGGVLTPEGKDVTDAFRQGAEAALELCRTHGIEAAILKERSPSCGVHQIYDGTHQGRVIAGSGLTAELLREHGIRLYTEEDYEQLLEEST